MRIDTIKNELKLHLGNKALIKCNIGRNKIESYTGIIKKLYNRIFVVEVNHNNTIENKTFSYSDIINKTVKIVY